MGGRSKARWVAVASLGAVIAVLIVGTRGAGARGTRGTDSQPSPKASFFRPPPAARASGRGSAYWRGPRARAGAPQSEARRIRIPAPPTAGLAFRAERWLLGARALRRRDDAAAPSPWLASIRAAENMLRAELIENAAVRAFAASLPGLRPAPRLRELLGEVVDARLGQLESELTPRPNGSRGELAALPRFEVDERQLSLAPVVLAELGVVLRALRIIQRPDRRSARGSLPRFRESQLLPRTQAVLNGIADALRADGSAADPTLQPEIGRIAVLAKAVRLNPATLMPVQSSVGGGRMTPTPLASPLDAD